MWHQSDVRTVGQLGSFATGRTLRLPSAWAWIRQAMSYDMDVLATRTEAGVGFGVKTYNRRTIIDELFSEANS